MMFFIEGTYVHFWFFPALIYSITVAYLLKKVNLLKAGSIFTIIAFVIGLSLYSYRIIGSNIPVWNILLEDQTYVTVHRLFMYGPPFFFMGYFLNKTNFDKVTNKGIITKILIFGALFCIEITGIKYFEFGEDILVTIFLYPLMYNLMLLFINNPIPQYIKASNVCRNLANFTFYSHMFFKIAIQESLAIFFGYKIGNAPLFFLVLACCLISGYILQKSKNKYIKLLF